MSRLQNRLDRISTALTRLLPASRAPEPERTSGIRVNASERLSRVPRSPAVKSIPDPCSCCNASKTTIKTLYWDGTLDDLQSAAENGCTRCAFLTKCVASFASNIFQKQNGFRVWPNFSTCELTLHRNGEPEYIGLDVFALHGQNSTPFKDIPVKCLLPGDTSSDMTSMTIAGWMKDCKSNHTDCDSVNPAFDNTSYTPKRLLDLTDARVVLRENVPDSPVYACLSHCWGRPADITKTTLENLQDFKLAILWEDLTKTFQHAVEICRRADINFLWIDSLCIIQNCKDDWNEQAPQMASIYKNAWVTIAATSSKGSTEGCYRKTDDDYLAKCVPGTDVYVRRRPPEFPSHWTDLHSEDWPLLNRGWIYQEMRLSRRTLHFCSQEVVWECQNARRSESRFIEQPLGSKDTRTYMHTMYEATPYSKLAKDPRMLWYRTIQEYSRLQLTFEEDKMPALAALTQDMEAMRVDDRFLAGLWEKTLLLDLLWMVWPAPKTGLRATTRAPTWSWASVRSQVIWGSSVEYILSSVKVDNIRYVTTGPPSMGVIQEASITLRVPLLRARLESGELCWDPTTPFSSKIVIKDKKMDYDFSVPGQFHIPSPTEVFIAPMGIDKLNCYHAGIVLLKKHGMALYERVGCVRIAHREVVEMMEEQMMSARDTTRSSQLSELRSEKMDLVTTLLTGLPVRSVTII